MAHIAKEVRYICLLFLGFITTSCHQSEDDFPVYFENAKLRVLAIGNSFTRNATLYMPEILHDTYSDDNIAFCSVIQGGASLETHCDNFDIDTEEYQFGWTTGVKWHEKNKTNLISILKYSKWDIVVIQQLSDLSGIPESYVPFLSILVDQIRRACPNALIGWQMTWSYSRNSTHPAFKNYNNNSEQMLHEIRATLSQVKPYVDIIIPSGELINLLRQTKFNTSTDLTVDGYHLSEGLPCFALSCLWHETLITPFTSVSCRETTLGVFGTPILAQEEKEIIKTFLNQIKE